MSDVFIISAVRTAIGRRGGVFKDTHPINLIAPILCEAADRAAVQPGQIEDVILGCVTPLNEQGGNIARLALLHAGFPVHVPGVQLNRMCGSGQQAVHFAAQAIAAGDMDIVLAGGVEHMTRVPIGSDWPKDGLPDWPYEWIHQGISAEMVADQWGLTRDDLDDYSFESHRRAAEATKNGYFEREILPLAVKVDGVQQVAKIDEGIRFEVDRAKMGDLKPAFKEGGKVTAGNSSQISDGACALILASEAVVKRNS
jgi:acetyl-CoA acyltransferase